MFSGHLTIDSMVQMLARFKESSVKRYNVNLYKAFASFGILLRVCLRLW